MIFNHSRQFGRRLLLGASLVLGLTASAGHALAQRLYVSSPNSNSLLVYNAPVGSPLSLVKSIPVGAGPQGVALSPDKRYTYVANAASASVSVIDNSTLTVAHTIPVGNAPYDVVVSPDGSRAYVANSSIAASSVSVINTATNQVITNIPVDSQPVAITTSANGAYVFTANYEASSITAINTSNYVVDAIIPGIMNAYDVIASPDNLYLYAVASGSNEIHKIELPNFAKTSASTSNNPHSAALSSDGTRLITANYSDHDLTDINTFDMSLNTAIITTGNAHNITLDDTDSRIFTTGYGDNTIRVFDASNGDEIDSLNATVQVSGIAYAASSPSPHAIPTLTEWAMILFAMVLAGFAALTLQRRRQMA